MNKETKQKMFETADGNVSSTRVMAWDTWIFTKWLMVIGLAIIVGLIIIDMYSAKNVDPKLIDKLISIYTYTLVALFLSIYAPKAWSKIGEVVGEKWGKGKAK